MLKIYFAKIIVLVFLMYNSAIPQSQDHDSTKAIQNYHTFNIYLYSGYGVSYNLINCNNSYLRLHLDLYNNYDKIEEDGKRITENETTEYNHKEDNESESTRFNISFSPQYLYEFYKSNIGSAYFGGGPKIGYLLEESTWDNIESRKNVSDPDDFYEREYDYKNKETNFTLGMVILIGFQTKITKHFGIFAESYLSFGRTWTTRTSEDYNKYGLNSVTNSKFDLDRASWGHYFQISRIGITIAI